MHTIDRRHHCFALVSVSIARSVHYDGINRLFKGRKRFPEIGKMTNKKPSSLKCWMIPLKSANTKDPRYFRSAQQDPCSFRYAQRILQTPSFICIIHQITFVDDLLLSSLPLTRSRPRSYKKRVCCGAMKFGLCQVESFDIFLKNIYFISFLSIACLR